MTNSVHPIFRLHIPQASSNGSHISLRAASSASTTQLRLEPTPLESTSLNALNAIPKTNQNAASGKFDSVNTFLTSKKSLSEAQIDTEFPIYSYRRYKPLPTVVYTQHEEEANDLLAGLKPGYVILKYSRRVVYDRLIMFIYYP